MYIITYVLRRAAHVEVEHRQTVRAHFLTRRRMEGRGGERARPGGREGGGGVCDQIIADIRKYMSCRERKKHRTAVRGWQGRREKIRACIPFPRTIYQPPPTTHLALDHLLPVRLHLLRSLVLTAHVTWEIGLALLHLDIRSSSAASPPRRGGGGGGGGGEDVAADEVGRALLDWQHCVADHYRVPSRGGGDDG